MTPSEKAATREPEILRLWFCGKTLPVIATEVGVPEAEVSRLLHGNNLIDMRPGRVKLDAVDRREIVVLAATRTMSVAQIAGTIGCDDDQVVSVLSTNGIRIPALM